jgi:hypothetical protein
VLANYVASRTLARFHQSEAFFRVVVGPISSGKSTAAIMELFRRSVEQAPNAAGIRPTRWGVIRNTSASIKQTTLPDILAYLGPLAVHRVSDNMVRFDFPLADGTRVQSDWLLIPLEEPKDVRRLLSLQLTGVFLEELRVLDMKIITDALGRCGRYPSLAAGGVEPSWSGGIAVTNPWPNGSAHHQTIEIERPEGWECFRQPSGIGPDAENVQWQVVGYYDRLMAGATDEWIRVNIMGENGQDVSGQAVFQAFSWDMHVSKARIRILPGRQVLIGLDTDRHAAAVIGQIDVAGTVMVMDEEYGEGIGLELFWSEQLRPLLASRYPSCSVVAIVDPSAARRSSITEESQLQALHRFGLAAVLAPTNAIDPRLRAVDELFTRQVGGRGAILIDGERCPMLVRAMASEYKYARSSKGVLAPLPDKTQRPFADLADGLQYLALGTKGLVSGMGLQVRYPPGMNPRSRSVRRVAAGGWT